MRSRPLPLCFVGLTFAAGAESLGCADVIGADFDVHEASTSSSSSTSGTTSTTDPSAPVVLVSGVDQPKSVAVDDHFVFWTEPNAGRVMRVSVDGGDPIVVASDEHRPDQIAAAGGYVYWTCSSSTQGSVRRANTRGDPPEDVALDQNVALGIGLDEINAYWATQSSGTIRAAAIASLPAEPTELTPPVAAVALLTLDKTDIYFTATNPDGGIYRVAKSGGTPEKLADAPWANVITLLGDLVCWTTYKSDSKDNSIRCIQKNKMGLTEVLGAHVQPTGLVSDGERLFWGELQPGAIMTGGPAMAADVLVDGQSPNGLALDGDTLYWANMTVDGSIMKMQIQ